MASRFPENILVACDVRESPGSSLRTVETFEGAEARQGGVGFAAFGFDEIEKFGRGAGRPLIVVDFGTATTLDAITAKGEYLGGAICPGVQISADALFQRAARLPRIDVRKPARIVGRTTVGAMESGLFYGYVGMVEGLVRRMTDELGGSAISVATGGLADVIAPETPVIQHVDPDLTLHGLRIVWQRNQPTTAGR